MNIRQKVINAIAEVNEEILDFDGDDIYEAGLLDSLQILDVITELEDAFSIVINSDMIILPNFKTISSIEKMVLNVINSDEKCNTKKDNWSNIYELYGSRLTVDPIILSGWKSIETGEYFTEAEMEEMVNNVLIKVGDKVVNKRVLEIGCGSGLLMYRLVKSATNYIGLDYAKSIIERNKEIKNKEGIQNLSLYQKSANQIDEFKNDEFDVIIMNSVSQAFPNEEYFEDVLRKASSILKENGVFFVGDIMDRSKKNEYIDFLERSNWHDEYTSNVLMVDEDFFNKICKEKNIFANFKCSRKIGNIKNELTEFRFDAMLYK